jgi:hypothetical protein
LRMRTASGSWPMGSFGIMSVAPSGCITMEFGCLVSCL